MKRSVPQTTTVTVPAPTVNVDMGNIVSAIERLADRPVPVLAPAESPPPRKLEVTVTERDVRGGIKKLEIIEL